MYTTVKSAHLKVALKLNINIMEEKKSMGKNWVELSTSEAEAVRGGIGLGNIKHLLKLIGSLFNFAHDYYEDFKRGYENGWNLF